MTRKLKAHEKIKGWQYKVVNGKRVKPVLYAGKAAGFGNYMAAAFVDSRELVCGSNERAIPYNQIIESDDEGS